MEARTIKRRIRHENVGIIISSDSEEVLTGRAAPGPVAGQRSCEQYLPEAFPYFVRPLNSFSNLSNSGRPSRLFNSGSFLASLGE